MVGGTQKAEFTHLAGEFHVLSCLNRKNIASVLTLGSHKAIDIVVEANGKIKTIDVKAVDKNPVFLGKKPKVLHQNSDHYYVVVFFGHKLGAYSDTNIAPEVYIVPSKIFCELAEGQAKRTPSKALAVKTREIKEYKDRWGLLK